MVLEAENAIEKLRKVMGATDPAKADAGTIRKQFGTNIERNAIHGSDGPETRRSRSRISSISSRSSRWSDVAWSNSAELLIDHWAASSLLLGLVSDVRAPAAVPASAGCRWIFTIQRDNFSFYFPLGTSIRHQHRADAHCRVC